MQRRAEATYPLRLPMVLLTSSMVPVVMGILCVTLIGTGGSWLGGIGLGLLVAVSATLVNAVRIRRRSLSVCDDVLVAQRDGYRLVVPWTGVTAVQRRRHHGLIRVEELICRGATAEPLNSRGQPRPSSRLPVEHPAYGRVLVSLYDKDWRDGVIGSRLRREGVDLGDARVGRGR